MKPGILVSTPDLRPSLQSILIGLDQASLLRRVVTTIALCSGGVIGGCLCAAGNLLPAGWKRGIDRRMAPVFLKGKVTSIWAREIVRLAASRWGNDVQSHRVWRWAEIGFDRKVARRFVGEAGCVYGMEHSSLETFVKQKDLRGLCVLRQVIPHARTVKGVIEREVGEFPECRDDYTRVLLEEIDAVVARKEAEYDLSDLIVVNSDFVRDSFVDAGINPGKIASIPTGCPAGPERQARVGRGEGPLIFLFAGTLSLRKGLPCLLKAWRLLDPGKTAKLQLAGKLQLPESIFTNEWENICRLGAVSSTELSSIYQQADVLVLPTLCEGLSHVVLEALSHGLPIITTRESGCGRLVEEGQNGFIVPAGNVEELSNALAWCLKNRRQLAAMGNISAEHARGWTVADSNRAHLKVIQEFLERHQR